MTYLGACAGPGWIFRSAAFVGRAIFLSLFPPHASALESFAARLRKPAGAADGPGIFARPISR